MTGLAIALVGGLLWIGLRGNADVATFCVGAVVSSVSAWAFRLPLGGSSSPARLARGTLIVLKLLFQFSGDLVLASARQTWLVLKPNLRVRPRWVRFETCLERPSSRLVLGVLISLTPGTVTEELRGKEFVIHVLDSDTDEEPVNAIRDRLEASLARLEAL